MTHRQTAPCQTSSRGLGTAAAMLVAGSLLALVAAATPPANGASGQGSVYSHIGLGGH